MDIKKGWTGERLETFIYNESTAAHLHRYGMAIGLVKQKIVLDIACGEGYGTNLLSSVCNNIIGVDIDEDTIRKAQNKYTAANIQFKTGTADNIPVETASVDVVVSFETLEHHQKHNEMMKEVLRVLKPNGILIISTPDKKNYSEKKNYVNPYHVKELYAHQFKELLVHYFPYAQFYKQSIFKGSLIIADDANNEFLNFEGDYTSIRSQGGYEPTYWLAICSKDALSMVPYNSGFSSAQISQMLEAERAAEKRTEGIHFIKNSLPYRVGNIILWPLKVFKNLLGK